MAGLKWSPEDWARLGERIRKSRGEQGLSRNKLAEMSGVSEKSIQLTEEGRVPTRWPKSLDALEAALGWASGLVVAVLDGYDPDAENAESIQPSGADGLVDFVIKMPDGTTRILEAKRSSAPPSGRYARMGTAREAQGAATFTAKATMQVGQPVVTRGRLAQDVFVRQMKRYRKLQGVTTQELAKRVAELGGNLDQEAIESLEAGVRFLRTADAELLARALETSVDWLLGSGFRSDAPEELTAPSDEEELKSEADAVIRRVAEARARLQEAERSHQYAEERAAAAQAEAAYARMAVEQAADEMSELEHRLHYLRGRLDTLRAARGEEIQPSRFSVEG